MKKWLQAIYFVLVGLLVVGGIVPAAQAAEAVHIRMNSGGGAYTDTSGNVWAADQYYNTGHANTNTAPIAGTESDSLYQTERWDEAAAPELTYAIPVPNGAYEVRLRFAEMFWVTSSVGARVFDVTLEGNTAFSNLDIFREVGANAALVKIADTTVSDGVLHIGFKHKIENPTISAIEIIGEAPHLAHAAAGPDVSGIDMDNMGSEPVTLDGHFSHTHQPGQSLTSYVWKEGSATLGTGAIITPVFATGSHTVTLTVTDGAGNTDSDSAVVKVHNRARVPGLSAYYYNMGSTLTQMPWLYGELPDWGQVLPVVDTPSTGPPFQGIPFASNFATLYSGKLYVPTAGSYTLAIESNDGSKLSLDGQVLIDNDGVHGMARKAASKSLTAGYHDIFVEYFQQVGNAGMRLLWTRPGQSETVIPAANLFHDATAQQPIINTISPTGGPTAGGNQMVITGHGFYFTKAQTTVLIGGKTITGNALTITDNNRITLTVPSGTGNASVQVQTPFGTSKAKTYAYGTNPPPAIQFTKQEVANIPDPTVVAYGPDGKLYVGTRAGEVWILTLDANYTVTNTQRSQAVLSGEPNDRTILGIAFNPLDDPANPRVYVSHSQLFHTNLPYNGKVSILSGAGLIQKQNLITGLPVSGYDHGVNGLEFGPNGELYIQVGGNTNAGVPSGAMGGLIDTSLSAATLVANIQQAGFNGNITYNAGGIQTGGDVSVYAAGFRNPYDIAWHSNGKLYGTDNGANEGFGERSTSCSAKTADPESVDELNWIQSGAYYGAANRTRGLSDARQCIYRPGTEASSTGYTVPITTFLSSTDGLLEYYANTFGGQLRGSLVASRLSGALYRVVLAANGQTVTSNTLLDANGGLDVAMAPEGSLFVTQFFDGKLIVLRPNEPAPASARIVSATPRRGQLAGGRAVVVTGNNFGSSPQVTIGGRACPVQSALSTRIVCTVPTGAAAGAVAVQVTSGGQTASLAGGYIYMNR